MVNLSDKNKIKAPRLAKLTAPRLSQVYNRTRLFEKIDEARAKPVIWISAPAGSGKTTLVTSYLKERNISPLWYQVDEGDADIASFYYYLGLLHKNELTKSDNGLPILTPEYLYGLSTFTRNFFRGFFSRMSVPGILVLDNFQDAGLDIPMHNLLHLIFKEIPEGINVIVVSRTNPTSSLTRLLVIKDIEVIGWSDLQTNKEETEEIIKIHNEVLERKCPENVIERLHEYSQGWISGLVLMLQSNTLSNERISLTESTPELLFEYFANELFDRVELGIQEFLIKTAFVPYLTPCLVTKLVSFPNAEDFLSGLHKKNYFISTLNKDNNKFQYHALFRSFLMNRAESFFDKSTLKLIKEKSATALLELNMPDKAAIILQENESWDELTQLIFYHAHKLIDSGSYLTLRGWIEKIPTHLIDVEPWLLFWLGASYQPYDILKSREYYEQAYHLFYEDNNSEGAYLSWSSAIDTFLYIWADFHPLDIWIMRYEKLNIFFPKYPTKEIEVRVVTAMFSATLWRKSTLKDISVWIKRAENLMSQNDIAIHSKVVLANNLLIYYMWWRGDIENSKILMNTINILTVNQKLPPITELLCKARESIFLSFTKPVDDCLQVVKIGLEISNKTGISGFNFLLNSQAVYACFCSGEHEKAKSYLVDMSKLIIDSMYVDVAHYYYLLAWSEIIENNIGIAESYLDIVLDNSYRSGMPAMIFPAMTLQAEILLEKNKYSESKKILDLIFKDAVTNKAEYKIFHCMLTYYRISMALDRKEEALIWLRKALARAKEQGYERHSFIGWRRDVMADIYAIALEENIEVEYTLFSIQKQKLAPPSSNIIPNNWLYPIKISTFGTFKLHLYGEEVVFTGKAQKKPIELLKFLISYGGENVNAKVIAGSLWPDADGDAAYKSFTMTLKRTRDLIQNKEALILIDGKLSFDPKYVWLDIWVVDQEKDKNTSNHLQSTLDLYEGHFLEDEDYVWALEPRQRWKNNFNNIVTRLAGQYVKDKNWKSAIAVYEKGVYFDSVVEHFYLGLMECNSKIGRRVEAIKVYEACEKNLLSHLGVTPSADVVKLYQKLCEG